ncbi:MAG: cation:proton antiporter [Myxococcales bacterium]|nr:cation:proton antiporter [Myxococcales bacterium]USN50327.1 MAG: cation:proton antiporter [Myxococcales bacterium]
MDSLSTEVTYVLLIFTLFVVPHFFHRYKIPAAIITFLLGVLATVTGIFQLDTTTSLLATIGISALFLFAGMEVEFDIVKKHTKILAQHLFFWGALLALVTWGIHHLFDLAIRPSIICSLALLTPSTGFIIESLEGYRLNNDQNFMVKLLAIGTEIIALLVMFIALQSESAEMLSLSILAMIGIVAAMPFLFLLFARLVLPHAPNADFAFYLMLAVIAGFLTKKIGAYYLIGAFIVGIAARRFESLFPSRDTEITLQSLRLFSTFFVPFYFFKAGMSLELTSFTWMSLLLGIAFFVVMMPLRVGLIMMRSSNFFKIPRQEMMPIALSLLPTLVFGLVLVDILNKRFNLNIEIINALMIYTILGSIVPRFFIKSTEALKKIF